jgi:hypothetical protein
MAALNPGIPPIFRDPEGNLTNVPPKGNDPGWSLAAVPTSGAGVNSINGMDGSVTISGSQGVHVTSMGTTVSLTANANAIPLSPAIDGQNNVYDALNHLSQKPSGGAEIFPTAPAAAPNGTLWYDSTNFRLMIRISGSWVQVA